MSAFIFVDRYSALGIPRPDPKTVCHGRCEGTGFVPISLETTKDPVFLALWADVHARAHSDPRYAKCDGWHFVKCPACAGTGKRGVGGK